MYTKRKFVYKLSDLRNLQTQYPKRKGEEEEELKEGGGGSIPFGMRGECQGSPEFEVNNARRVVYISPHLGRLSFYPILLSFLFSLKGR